jgi:hypothetical protein
VIVDGSLGICNLSDATIYPLARLVWDIPHPAATSVRTRAGYDTTRPTGVFPFLREFNPKWDASDAIIGRTLRGVIPKDNQIFTQLSLV